MAKEITKFRYSYTYYDYYYRQTYYYSSADRDDGFIDVFPIAMPIGMITLWCSIIFGICSCKLMCKTRFTRGVLRNECVCSCKKETPKFRDPDSVLNRAIQSGIIANNPMLRLQHAASVPPPMMNMG